MNTLTRTPLSLLPLPSQRRGPAEAERFDVVVAGAGPAGLACARTLAAARSGARILVCEAGRGYRHRPCPVDRGFACTGCGGVCNVISGFFGSVHYGDGVKLSLLPSGRRLADHFGQARAAELCRAAFAMLTAPLSGEVPLRGTRLSAQVTASFADVGLEIRRYPVAVLSESQVRRIVEAWHASLAPAWLWESAEVLDARPESGGLAVCVARHGQVDEVHADSLVLATGRRGVSTSAHLLEQLAAPLADPEISVGVRLEMPARLLDAVGREHPDLKVTQRGLAVKIKTFCFCGGPNGGRVKFTHYQGAFGDPVITLDGHETTERTAAGGRELAANFGLLCQVQGRGDASAAREAFLAGYRRESGAHPFAQSLRAFLDRESDEDGFEQLAAALPFQPSVRDLSCGRVDRLFTPEEYASLTAGLRQLLGAIIRHAGAGGRAEDVADQILVIAPELEFLWPRPAIDASCRLPGLPLYVVGDAAGIAQGVVQGAMMGIAAGRDLAAQPIPAAAKAAP